MNNMNRLANCKNPYQGAAKKVLCVCSAGLLRSPTAAEVLSREPFNYNTRAAGIETSFALIPVDEVLIEWADEIICMTQVQAGMLRALTEKYIHCLNIPDSFEFRNTELQEMIARKYKDKVLGEIPDKAADLGSVHVCEHPDCEGSKEKK
jgi:predicted protein tyrosine phosphatase